MVYSISLTPLFGCLIILFFSGTRNGESHFTVKILFCFINGVYDATSFKICISISREDKDPFHFTWKLR
jgi:hypothetical protein